MASSCGTLTRHLSTSISAHAQDKSYKVLVIGGGAGGCSAAAKFAKKLGRGKVGVIEPNDVHYYQPMWTLVGGGLKSLSQSGRPMASVLPKEAEWLKTKAMTFDPDKNTVTTEDGTKVQYEYAVIAMGIQANYDSVKGLTEALENTPEVCSNYDVRYVEKTANAIKNFQKGGNAVFTFPKPPIKCPGAPQKIAYIAERQLQKDGKRDGSNIMYFATLPVIFGVKKYADALWKVVNERNIQVNLNRNLVEVDGKEAVFENLEDPSAPHQRVPFELLHVSPPFQAPSVLKESSLVDESGFVTVNGKTLQHVKYKNVFALGDCTNVATSKTAAAVAVQLGVLRKNLTAVMEKGPGALDTAPSAQYNGYTSCPLVTGPGECILAEFDNSVPPQPMETFPFDQGRPRWSMYQAKANMMPHVYWQMLKGRWEGPQMVKTAFSLGMK